MCSNLGKLLARNFGKIAGKRHRLAPAADARPDAFEIN
jgi:hypothetical protein